MAEQDYYDHSLLYFSIFEVSDSESGSDIRILVPRVQIELPDDESSSTPNGGEEETKGGRRCEFPHPKRHQEFTSAAAAQSTFKSDSKSASLGKPFVSQICFSNDQYYIAILLSGPINRVMVYEWKTGKKQPLISQGFEMIGVQEEPMSPNVGD